jgi:DNA-binding response OmpR family regulator
MANATATATIMIVEDEPAVRELLVLSLEAHDFDTVAAGTVSEALTSLESRQVDLLLLDLRLNGESGLDLLKAIRKMPLYEKLPVILLTGVSDRNIVLQVAQLGVQGYLLKHQFSRKELSARIDQILKNRATPAPPAQHDETPANGQWITAADSTTENQTAISNMLRVVKPVLTRAQTIEQMKRRSESRALPSAVANLLAAQGAPASAKEQISAVVGSFPAIEPNKYFDYELFWQHSIATGLIAAELTRLRDDSPEAINFAFTAGLLHDVAQLVLLQQLDDIYKRVLDTAARLQLPLEQVESKMLMGNHADLADCVLDPADIPSRLVNVMLAHHLPTTTILKLPVQKFSDVATLALADRLAHAMLLGFGANNSHYPTETLAQALGITIDTFERIENLILGQTATLCARIFDADKDSSASEYRQHALSKFRQPLRPLYICANPATDGYRILLSKLTAQNDAGPSNIAVLYLTGVANADSLLGTLREREAVAKIKPLPLILISPLANLSIDAKRIGDREYRKIPSPFTLFQLADAIDSLLPASEA